MKVFLTLAIVLSSTIIYAQEAIPGDPVLLPTTPTKEDHVRERWTNVGPSLVSIDVSKSSRIVNWRFCHDGTNLTVLPWEGNGETWSIYHICECESLAHCLKVIETKKLKVTEEQQASIDELEQL